MKESFDILDYFIPTLGPRKEAKEKSKKGPLFTLFLSIFFGWWGIDLFYLERIDGILKLVTFGGFGTWWLLDIILILTGKMRDGEGKLLESISIM